MKVQKKTLHYLKNHETKSTALEKQKTELANKLVHVDLEAGNMRDNLIFYGIPERSQKDAQNNPENSESLIKVLVTMIIDLDDDVIRLDRAHRLGGNRARKPRALVVKFHYYSEREQVRQQLFDKAVKKPMPDDNYGIGIQVHAGTALVHGQASPRQIKKHYKETEMVELIIYFRSISSAFKNISNVCE